MGRLNRVAAALAIVGLTTPAAYAQTRPAFTGVQQTARVLLGSIQGSVSDDRGGPLAGAMVSALGATMAMAVTDTHGRFAIDSLPPGDYVVRVHLAGFISTRRDNVRVGTAPATVDRIELHKKDPVVGTTGTAAAAPDAPTLPIMAAGLELPSADAPAPDSSDDDHPHSELAWRLRHLKRSALKDSGDVVAVMDDSDSTNPADGSGSLFGRALDGAASLAASFFADPPFTGEVNLLTTSAVSPGQQIFSGNFLPRGVAYLSIGAPVAGGEWAVRASMSQSDTSSWILAGSYTSSPGQSGDHDYGFGVSYSTQQYQVRTAQPLAFGGMNDDSRAVGELSASDRWTISPLLALEYGGRYAHYDYLQKRSLLSPRVGATITPLENTHITAVVSQRMLAPGAEEFLAPTIVGPWLPPERTFAPLAGEDLRVERGRFLDLGVDHEFDSAIVLGMRRFYQRVDDQLITLFGLPATGGPKSPGHYYVASGGAVDADGWAVRLSTPASQRVRASVDYSLTHAQWMSRGDMAAVVVWAPEAVRPQSEDIHDVTTSVETDIPETATRVFFLYKVNTAFARGLDPIGQRLDSRFDLQVNQALPFMPLGSTRWEVLVGIRNLFRDPADAGSVYDELLVIHPPKRVVGGVLIRF
jgi:Carboxypeptidase regulatory-like domain/TonB dependent receptor